MDKNIDAIMFKNSNFTAQFFTLKQKFFTYGENKNVN